MLYSQFFFGGGVVVLVRYSIHILLDIVLSLCEMGLILFAVLCDFS